MARRTVVVGLDGVPAGLLRDLAGRGAMPAVRRLLDEGVLRAMRSSLPEISSVAWSSIITGAGPARHGVFGFTDTVPSSLRLRFPGFRDLRVPPFWEDSPVRSVLVNLPGTYPVRPMNGVHISGFVSIDLDKAVHPASLAPFLRSVDYRLDVDSSLAHTSMDRFLEDVDRTLAARAAVWRKLWDDGEWGFFMVVFTGTDRLMHFLWDAYEDESHPYHRAFLDRFAAVDREIGEIARRLGDGDALVMLSDHGFERLRSNVNLNFLLREAGFLETSSGGDPMTVPVAPGSRAFALDPSRVYLNMRGRYPDGSVEPCDRESLIADLSALFGGLRHEGRPAIRRVFRREDIYEGPLADQAPDLVLLPESGFNLKAGFRAGSPFSADRFTGKHTYDDAFLYVRGGDPVLPEDPEVTDVRAILRRTGAAG